MNWLKIVKWILIGIVGLFLLIFATAYLLIRIYSSEIRQKLTDNVREQLGLELKLESIQLSLFTNWPNTTLELKNVEAASLLFNGPKENFVKAEAIFVSFSLRKLFHKQLSIKRVNIRNAKILLRKLKNGSRNYELKKLAKDSTKTEQGFEFDIQKVVIKNTEFTFLNEERNQRFNLNLEKLNVGFIKHANGFEADLTANIHVGGLIFKSNKGAFFKNSDLKLDLVILNDKISRQLCVYPPSFVEIEKKKYKVTCLLNYEADKKLFIWIDSPDAELFKVSKLLNSKIQKVLSNFHVSKPLKANFLLGLAFGKRQDPILVLNAESANNTITIGVSKVQYTNVSFKAKIISITPDKLCGDEDKALVLFDPVIGNVNDFPFTATIHVYGLRDSKINIQAGVLIDAGKIKFDFAKKLNLKGECRAKINISGPATKLNKNEFLSDDMQLNAELWLNNLYFQPKANTYFFNLNGSAYLNQKYLRLKNMKVLTNGGSLSASGQVNNFVQYFLGLKSGLKADLDVKSERFDFGHYFQHKTKKSMSRSVLNQKNAVGKKRLLQDDQVEMKLNFTAKIFEINKIKAQNARIVAEYKKEVLNLKSINMEICDGELIAKGSLDHWENLRSEVDVKNVNISKLFEQMDNFGQASVKSGNLAGHLNLKANFNAMLDDQKEMIPGSLYSEVKLKLSDGHLINFEPMLNISQHVFRNRDFKDITFTEINESFLLRGQSMKIEEMELASNVSNMFISGVYNFKDNSCINILVPWSNFKHRGKDYVAKTSGGSAEDTKGVRLNFTGPPGKMKLGVGYCKPGN